MVGLNRIFIDECGYTGEDLFNADQPVFVLASLHLSDECCIALKNKHFSKVKAKELKHSRLSKYQTQQGMVIDFLRDMTKQSDSAGFAIAHKRYVLVTYIVDLIVEPVAYEDGLDFYRDGLNIACSNVLYFVTQTLAGKEFFENMIHNFQLMMRERTYDAYESFFKPFFETHFDEKFDRFLDRIRESRIRYGPSLLRSIPKESLEIAFSLALNLVAEWSKSITGNFSLVHDKSSNMAKNKKVWDKILHPDATPKVVGYDRRKMYFPIRVERTDFEDSQDFAGLQLADIMAGAMARCLEWTIQGQKGNDDYAKELSSFLPGCF